MQTFFFNLVGIKLNPFYSFIIVNFPSFLLQLFNEVSVFVQVESNWFVCKLLNLLLHGECIVNNYSETTFNFFVISQSLVTEHSFVVDICHLSQRHKLSVLVAFFGVLLLNHFHPLLDNCLFVLSALQSH